MSYGASSHAASQSKVPTETNRHQEALSLLPRTIGSGTASREIEGRMAIIILGGLFTSTTFNLLAFPAIVLRFGGRFVMALHQE